MTINAHQVIHFCPDDTAAQQLFAIALYLIDQDLIAGHWKLDIPRTVFESLSSEEYKRLFSDLIFEQFRAEPKMTIRITSEAFFRVSRFA